MHVTITSSARNAAPHARRCIRSVRDQTHDNFTHIFIDAGSEDGTYGAAKYEAGSDSRFVIRRAPSALNALENLLPVWRSLSEHEVVVWLDGDDALATPRALEFVAEQHEAGALCTYGQFMTTDGELGFCGPVGQEPRREPWRASHLKSFRAGLVHRIRDADFEIYKDGGAWGAWDQLIMLACCEMAAERAVFVPRVMVVYNVATCFETNANPDERAREHEAVRRIRALPPYERIASL